MEPSGGKRRQALRRAVLALVLLVWGAVAYWHTHKALPPGTHVLTDWVDGSPPVFIADITAADAYGRPVMSQAIFNQALRIIHSARQFIVLDYFLFNSQHGMARTTDPDAAPTRALCAELRDALIARHEADPELRILLITDPVNEAYGSAPSMDIGLLRAQGIDVVVTDLDELRDSNYIYSSLWRLIMRWWDGDPRGEGWLANPLDDGATRLTLGSWARLLNFKANHRKVLLADDGHDGLVGILGSANPHDASSAHSNAAFEIHGSALRPMLESELAIARFSGWQGNLVPHIRDSKAEAATTRIRILTEGAIASELLDRLGSAGRGESIDIAMFYLSDRRIVEALVAAAQRGAKVRLILDPNKDAFGREKNGIPNRPVASELVSASDGAIKVRWYRTHGEQFHTKLVMIQGQELFWTTLGSANLTRRNLDDYNLEANVCAQMPRGSPLARQMTEYFNTLWENRAPLGIEYTADFGLYSDPAQSHYWLYRVMEATGLSTF